MGAGLVASGQLDNLSSTFGERQTVAPGLSVIQVPALSLFFSATAVFPRAELFVPGSKGQAMTWRGLGFSVLATLGIVGSAVAQPAGGGAYFGAGPNDKFTPGGIFNPPPPSVIPAQDIQPIGGGADGGLLPAPLPPPPIWSGSAELGVNGATGNSELFNLRVGFDARRKVETNIFTTDFLYALADQNGIRTTNQALWNARDEVLFPGSPWSLFASLNLEYDELRAYDFRVGVYGGVGYTVIDDSDLTFKLRAGAGAVREIGNLPSRWVPEFVFGYDFRLKVNDRSSFVSVLDYYPRIDKFGQYRLRVRAAYENVLDPTNGIILRLGVQDRYDSDPGPAKKNDLTYFATLGVKF